MNSAETYILFELAGSSYGVRSKDVLHIDLLEHITPVPNTAPAVDGVVFSRGQVIPALNLRARFGFERAEPTPRTRLIFLRHEQRTVALIVDSAREFRAIPNSAIRPIEETLAGVDGNYLRGVATLGDRLVLLLDIGAVLTLDQDPAAAARTALQPTV
jgi:purine-binding chemotaxis protein CheW